MLTDTPRPSRPVVEGLRLVPGEALADVEVGVAAGVLVGALALDVQTTELVVLRVCKREEKQNE